MQPELPPDLNHSEALLRKVIGEADDIHFESFTVRWGGRRALLVFVEGITDRQKLEELVLQPLTRAEPFDLPPTELAQLGKHLAAVAVQRPEGRLSVMREAVYRGEALLVVEGYAGALLLDVHGWAERPVQSVPSEAGLRGPRDGFVENAVTNISLVRRRIQDPQLRLKLFRVGMRSQTKIAVLHLADVAKPRLVGELESRIASVSFDGILDSSQLRELLVGPTWSPFPKMEATERPDKAAAALLSGKVVIVVDTSPFVLIAPTTLVDTLWAPDDYYTNPAVTLFVRIVRVVGTFATVFLSPLYIGIEMFNPGLIRADLALFLTRERTGIPLTPALEIFFLEIMMEMVFEATVRLPAKVGSAATVVGGLIIGQAAVQARLLSGIVVVVAAISAIGSFTLPTQEMGQVWRATKWVLLLSATFFGVYGIFAASFILFSWLASQDSFGTPYGAPFAPLIPGDLTRDFLFRMPWGQVRKRPSTYSPVDVDRAVVKSDTRYRDGGER